MFSYSVLPTINNLLDIFKVFDKKKFDKNIKYLINNNTTYNFLSASSWSILLICKWKFKLTKKEINLWVPSYFCFSALRLLNLNEVNIKCKKYIKLFPFLLQLLI